MPKAWASGEYHTGQRRIWRALRSVDGCRADGGDAGGDRVTGLPEESHRNGYDLLWREGLSEPSA